MLSIPDEILEALVKYCKDAGLGLAHIGQDDMCMLLIGFSENHPNKIAIDGAHMLLRGVVKGSFVENNEANNSILEGMEVPKGYKPS